MRPAAWAWALLLVAQVVAQASLVRAQELHVEVADGACPNARQVHAALAPVVERGVTVVVEPKEAGALGKHRARVIDRGERYAIEIDGARREVDDPRRDCVARARVASVFIALNVQEVTPPSATEEPATTTTTSTSNTPRDEDAEEGAEEADEAGESSRPLPPEPPAGWGLLAFATGAYSTDADRTTFGAGAGVFYAIAPLRFELDAAVLAPIELGLSERDDIRGRVELLRVPTALLASYRLRLRGVHIGPSVGLAVELMHIEGSGVERPQSDVRLNLGALLGADLRLAVGADVGLLLRLQMHFLPKAYRLVVDPTGRLGETPTTWLTGAVGVEWRL